ncbi:hypothetical protein UB31_11030 [Bradyrhizobium sp. LTSP849]|nr:hypothetical protein UB31_11030 [Bradyrhizobium sp. LTSP849]
MFPLLVRKRNLAVGLSGKLGKLQLCLQVMGCPRLKMSHQGIKDRLVGPIERSAQIAYSPFFASVLIFLLSGSQAKFRR